MGRLSKAARRFRYGRAKVVLWGGRRYDIQVGSQRDLRRCARRSAAERLLLAHHEYIRSVFGWSA